MIISAGIKVASIADHETLDGYFQIRDRVPESLKLIPAVEFSTYYKGSLKPDKEGENGSSPKAVDENNALSRKREIHILGYFPKFNEDRLRAVLAEMQQERINRAKVTLVNLRKKGCRLSYEQLSEQVKGNCVSRAHMARAMLANGLVSSIYDAFNRYLDIAQDIVPLPLLTPKRAIALIRRENGIPVWAHPQLESFDLLVKKFVDYGLQGVEICNNRRGEPYSLYYERTARVLGLHATYGSDWHGIKKDPIKGVEAPFDNIRDFLDRVDNMQPPMDSG